MKIATLVLQTIAIAALAGCATVSKPGYDTLIAHRGESKDAPENTLPAYKLAVERGFGFECDLYLSKDGRVFTFHDSDLKRTTDGANSSKCAEVTWADTLSKLDVGSWGKWKDSKYAGTPPALLEDVLALAKNGRRIYLEIKAGPEIVPVIKAILSSQNNATPDNVLFICFSKGVCKAREAAADGVDMMFDPDVVDEAFVAAVKKKGLSFHVWTIDDLPHTLRAFAVGADTVTTNCAKELLDEYAMLFAPEPDNRDAFSDRIIDGAAFPTGL